MIQRFLKKGVVTAISYNQRIPLALYHQNAHIGIRNPHNKQLL